MAKKDPYLEDVKLNGEVIGYVEYDPQWALGPIWLATNTRVPAKYAGLGGGSPDKKRAKELVLERHLKLNFA